MSRIVDWLEARRESLKTAWEEALGAGEVAFEPAEREATWQGLWGALLQSLKEGHLKISLLDKAFHKSGGGGGSIPPQAVAAFYAVLLPALLRWGAVMIRWIDAFQKLVEAGLDLAAELPVEEVLQKVVDLAAQLASARYGAFGVLDETGKLGKFYTTGVDAETYAKIGRPPESMGLLGELLREGKPLHLKDLTRHLKFSGFPPHHPVGRSFLGVPVRSREAIVGDLYLMEKIGAEEFSEEDEAFLTAFASQAAVTIQNARLYEQAKARTRRFETLVRIAHVVTATLDPKQVCHAIVEAAVTLFPDGVATIWVLEDEAWLVRVADAGPAQPAHPERRARIRVGDWVVGWIAQMRQPLVVPDVRVDPRFQAQGWYREEGLHAHAGFPLLVGDRCLGVFRVILRGVVPFSGEELQLLQVFADQAAVAIQNARLYQELKTAAFQLQAEVEDRTRELRNTISRLEEASRHKSAFLANMSHELRTPLHAILGFTEILLGQEFGTLTSSQKDFLTEVHESGHHLVALIDDVLDLAKVEAGKLELRPEPFNLGEAIAGVCTNLQTLATEKELQVTVGTEETLPPLVADPGRVKQILYNLLSNAIKFTPQGGRVTIGARKRAGISDFGFQISDLRKDPESPVPIAPSTQHVAPSTEEWIEISVADTGMGIAPEDQARIFEAFEQGQVPGMAKPEGTGLGLALTRQLVELHGGQIWVESAGEGQGAIFTFTLPWRPPATSRRILLGEDEASSGGHSGTT